MDKIKIKIFPRIHITLIAMHEGEYRKNGGIGFTISDPFLEISFEKAENINVDDKRAISFLKDEKKRLINVLKKVRENCKLTYGVNMSIVGTLPTHYGFGSTTGIRLAALEGLCLINEYNFNRKEIVMYSSRGGTSGIGINTYFNGGMVLDIGVAHNIQSHCPSSTESLRSPPLIIEQFDMADWDIGLCIPTNIKPKSEQEEKIFFSKTCPIKKEDAYNTLYHVIYGIYASIKEGNRRSFNYAIREIQNRSWKKSERLLYGLELQEIENKLYALGAEAVGMSSLGPSLFFFSEDIDLVINKAKDYFPLCDFLKTSTRNKGRVIYG